MRFDVTCGFFCLQVGSTRSVAYNNFVVSRQIGSSSFKLVYKARWQQLQGSSADVAILRLRGSGLTERRDELEQKAKTFQQLGRHPNLLRLLAITVEPSSGDSCLVTELASKGSLDEILYKFAVEEETLGLLVQLQVVRQICDGMVQLSLHKVVHRGLGARNVLVFSLDAQDHLGVSVKIADYAGWTAQPVQWMAPESIERRQFSQKSDVWAFGLTMWEVWTYGQIPYEVIDGERPAAPASCPAVVYTIMQECWKKEEEERPSFSELQRKLQERYDEAVQERGQQCVICMDHSAEWALIPCGHKCLCEVCKEGATARKCPMCRSSPTSIYKIY